MYWYTIAIPRHKNGDIAKYSLGWFGVMDKCPNNVTVKIFNDKEGWLLAQVDDTFVPPEVTVISQAEADKLMSQTQQADNVFVGVQKIADRWAKQEADNVFVGVQKIADRWAKQEADRQKEIAARQKELFIQAVDEVLNG